jgi:hypothetical protein
MMATTRDPGSDLSPRKVAERLKEEGKQRLERGKTTAADEVEHVASALKSASNELGGQSTLGSYTNRLADSIEKFGSRLRQGSIEDLARDIQAAARRNPGLFVAGGLALGIVLARLVKASAPEGETYEGEYDELTAGTSSAGDVYRSSGAQMPDAPTVDSSSGGDLGTTPDSTRNTFGG